jgi:hypothetical protein
MALVRSFTHETSDQTKAVEQVMRGGNPIGQSGMGAVSARLRGASRRETGMPTRVYLSSDDHEMRRTTSHSMRGRRGGWRDVAVQPNQFRFTPYMGEVP